MPSVALFTYSVKPRGSVVHAAYLAEALADEGVDVTLYALAKGGDAFFRPLRCPLELLPAGPAPADPDRLIEQRIAELHAGFANIRRKYDVYHAQDCLTASALLTAASRLGTVARTVHHVEAFESPYLAACQRRSIERADLVLSVSKRTARDVLAAFGRASPVVYNGVDATRFARVATEPVDPDERLAIPAEARVVLSVGGVDPRKNALRTLEALARVLANEPHVYWVVAGGASIWDHSELERDFDARVDALPAAVKRRILRVGPVAEATLTWLYQRSLVLVSASLCEGWGLAALEGLAAGAAVVASAREPFTEFLDADVAVLVDPESTAAIAEAVATLVADGARRTRLSENGRARARAFSWRRTALAHLAAYRALAGNVAHAVPPASDAVFRNRRSLNVPEMHFHVEWPNGRVERCYSPSYVIEEHLAVGDAYPVDEFVSRARRALEIASERVLAKYGFACSSALDQLRALEESAAALPPGEREGQVRVLKFEKHAPRDARKSG